MSRQLWIHRDINQIISCSSSFLYLENTLWCWFLQEHCRQSLKHFLLVLRKLQTLANMLNHAEIDCKHFSQTCGAWLSAIWATESLCRCSLQGDIGHTTDLFTCLIVCFSTICVILYANLLVIPSLSYYIIVYFHQIVDIQLEVSCLEHKNYKGINVRVGFIVTGFSV